MFRIKDRHKTFQNRYSFQAQKYYGIKLIFSERFESLARLDKVKPVQADI